MVPIQGALAEFKRAYGRIFRNRARILIQRCWRTPPSESDCYKSGAPYPQAMCLSFSQVNHDVVVDTSSDSLVEVTSVYSTMGDGTYGVGEEIFVTVVFSAPVRGWSAQPADIQ